MHAEFTAALRQAVSTFDDAMKLERQTGRAHKKAEEEARADSTLSVRAGAAYEEYCAALKVAQDAHYAILEVAVSTPWQTKAKVDAWLHAHADLYASASGYSSRHRGDLTRHLDADTDAAIPPLTALLEDLAKTVRAPTAAELSWEAAEQDFLRAELMLAAAPHTDWQMEPSGAYWGGLLDVRNAALERMRILAPPSFTSAVIFLCASYDGTEMRRPDVRDRIRSDAHRIADALRDVERGRSNWDAFDKRRQELNRADNEVEWVKHIEMLERAAKAEGFSPRLWIEAALAAGMRLVAGQLRGEFHEMAPLIDRQRELVAELDNDPAYRAAVEREITSLLGGWVPPAETPAPEEKFSVAAVGVLVAA